MTCFFKFGIFQVCDDNILDIYLNKIM